MNLLLLAAISIQPAGVDTLQIETQSTRCSGARVGLNVILTASHCIPLGVSGVRIDGLDYALRTRIDDGKDKTLLEVEGELYQPIQRLDVDNCFTEGEQLITRGAGFGAAFQGLRLLYVSGLNAYGHLSLGGQVGPGDSGGPLYRNGVIVGVISYNLTSEANGTRYTIANAQPFNFPADILTALNINFTQTNSCEARQ